MDELIKKFRSLFSCETQISRCKDGWIIFRLEVSSRPILIKQDGDYIEFWYVNPDYFGEASLRLHLCERLLAEKAFSFVIDHINREILDNMEKQLDDLRKLQKHLGDLV